jgi:hypothetical protein
MTAAQFNALLEQMALLHQDLGDGDTAKGLRKLRELFDDASEQKLITIVKDIRVAMSVSSR